MQHIVLSWHTQRIHAAVEASATVIIIIIKCHSFVLSGFAAICASPLISHYVGASGLRIGESSSAKKTFVESEELPDADGV
jgi:hypothetical protein